MRVINCDLKSTLIIDNSIFSFAFQLDNGVPMIPFYDDKEDRIMLKIKDYLITLKDLEDVTAINKKMFSLTDLYECDITSFLKYYYDDEEMEDNSEDIKEADKESTKKKVKEVDSTKKCTSNPFNIRKKTQEVVENHLGKFKISFNEYLASKKK